jgi:hypothetical protein
MPVKSSSFLFIAAVWGVSVGIVCQKVLFFRQSCPLAGISVDVNVRRALPLDARPLMVIIPNPIAKVSLPDINWNPFVFGVKFRENVVSRLIRIKTHRKLVNVISVASLTSSDPVACVAHWCNSAFVFIWQNKAL